MRGKRSKGGFPHVDPGFLARQREALVRRHRMVICFNDKEMEAIDEYCRRLKASSRSSILRKAIMETVFAGLDEHHPTLFEKIDNA